MFFKTGIFLLLAPVGQSSSVSPDLPGSVTAGVGKYRAAPIERGSSKTFRQEPTGIDQRVEKEKGDPTRTKALFLILLFTDRMES